MINLERDTIFAIARELGLSNGIILKQNIGSDELEAFARRIAELAYDIGHDDGYDMGYNNGIYAGVHE